MSIATTTALAIGGIAAAGIGAGASLIGSKKQASAENNASTTEAQEAQNALNFQEQQYNTEQSQLAPYLKAGTTALGQLNGGSLPSFQAPTGATEQNDPGYQFRLTQGQQALENSAAAKGGLLSGNTGEALQQYGQNYASNEYQNVYNRAMNNYNTNVIGPYNRLAGLAGIGQQAQATGAAQGQQAASNLGSIDINLGQQLGNNDQNAAAATASGYTGAANSLNGGVNNIEQSILLSSLLGNQGQQGLGGTVANQDTV